MLWCNQKPLVIYNSMSFYHFSISSHKKCISLILGVKFLSLFSLKQNLSFNFTHNRENILIRRTFTFLQHKLWDLSEINQVLKLQTHQPYLIGILQIRNERAQGHIIQLTSKNCNLHSIEVIYSRMNNAHWIMLLLLSLMSGR